MSFFKSKNKKDIENPKQAINETNKDVKKPDKQAKIPKENSEEGTFEVKEPISKQRKFKKTKKENLTILLVENSLETSLLNDMIVQIINSLSPTSLVRLITYGEKVDTTDILPASEIRSTNIFSDPKENICLYDSLPVLENMVKTDIIRVIELDKEFLMFDNIEVIGIGTCKDKGSKLSKQEGIEYFFKVLKNSRVKTKYFCLTENDFMNAAEIGFRSIGSISRNY